MGAPVIQSVTLVPETVTDGEPVSALVTWTGDPAEGEIRYQWRRSGRDLMGETGQNHLVSGSPATLYCEVQVDNGRGVAIGASGYGQVTVEPDIGAFSIGFSGGFA